MGNAAPRSLLSQELRGPLAVTEVGVTWGPGSCGLAPGRGVEEDRGDGGPVEAEQRARREERSEKSS